MGKKFTIGFYSITLGTRVEVETKKMLIVAALNTPLANGTGWGRVGLGQVKLQRYVKKIHN